MEYLNNTFGVASYIILTSASVFSFINDNLIIAGLLIGILIIITWSLIIGKHIGQYKYILLTVNSIFLIAFLIIGLFIGKNYLLGDECSRLINEPGTTGASINFINNSQDIVVLSFVDDGRNERFYDNLLPGMKDDDRGVPNHPWCIRDKRTGREIKAINKSNVPRDIPIP